MTGTTQIRSTRRLGRAGALMLCLALAVAPATAGSKALGKADAAWHQGELEQAMALYQAALEAGGLQPADVVLAHSRIGVVRAALRDEPGALSSFRTAATINPEFELPADSGPLAKKLYAQARTEATASGEFLSVSLSAPETVPAKKAFQVVTVVPEAYAVLVTEMRLTIQNTETEKTWEKVQPMAAEITFDVPKKVAVGGARLVVRAEALDEKRNAWAVAEAKVKVTGGDDEDDDEAAAPAGMDSGEVSPFEQPAEKDKKPEEDGGFMAGPGPWIIGGAAAAVVGVVAIFFATASSDTATVSAATWR